MRDRISRSGPGLFALLCGSLVVFQDAGADRLRPARYGPGPRIEADLPSGQPIGTPIVWSVTPPADGQWDHRFSVRRSFDTGQPSLHAQVCDAERDTARRRAPDEGSVLRDFSPLASFEWIPKDEGSYVAQVTSRERSSGATRRAMSHYAVLAPAAQAAVSATRHPLVALYSARIPPGWGIAAADRGSRRGAAHRCSAFHHRMRVVFQAPGDDNVQATPARLIDPYHAMSFYVAGMRENTRYALRHEILAHDGSVVSRGPLLSFETGAAEVQLPAVTERIPRSTDEAVSAPIVLVSPILGAVQFPYATDLHGRAVWYDPHRSDAALTRLVPGGSFLEIIPPDEFRGIGFVGEVIRSTSVPRINQLLAARGEEPVSSIHHEVMRLPDGRTALLANRLQAGIGPSGEDAMPVLGDVVVVLDRELRIDWTWSSFDHLDSERPPTLGDRCTGGNPGCDGAPIGVVVNDWTHANAIDYSPVDGNLIVSVRNQDWIVKLDYRDGRGSGNVLWRLGREGDFSIDSNDPFPWHSHAHSPALLPGARLAVYDNGNTRCAVSVGCESRGQVYELDEANLRTRVVDEVRLERFSFALGSAQGLRSGGFHFGSGIFAYGAVVGSTAEEVVDDLIVWSQFQATLAYRSFRLRDLYSPPPSQQPEELLPAPEPIVAEGL